MKKKCTKIFALFMSAVSIILLVSGCSSSSSISAKPGSGTGQYAEHMTFSWLLPTQQDISVSESKIMQKVMEKFNVDFEFTELPPTDQHPEKVKLFLASQQMPDFMSWVTKDDANSFGKEGAFIELSQYFDKLPNYKMRLDNDPDGRYNAYTPEGEVYEFSEYYMKNVPTFDFGYSKDEIEKVYNGKLETFDELYTMLKAMKKAYPDSFPFAMRGAELGASAVKALFVLGFTENKADMWSGFYPGYDYDAKKYIVSAEAPGFEDTIRFLNKLLSEGLMDPEYLTLDMDNLLSRVKDNKTFLIADFSGGLSGIPELNAKADNKLYPLELPVAAGKRHVLGGVGVKIGGKGTVLNAKLTGEKLERALDIIDWFYSDEAYEFLYWNPDVTVKGEGGSTMYVDDIYNRAEVVYDTYLPWGVIATFLVDYETVTKPGTPYADYKRNVLTNPENKDLYTPTILLPFTTEENDTIAKLSSEAKDYYDANIELFVMGKKSFDEWPAFIEQLKNKGAQELCDLFNKSLEENF